MVEHETSESKNYTTLYKALGKVQEYLGEIIKVDKFEVNLSGASSCGTLTSLPQNITKTHSDLDLIVLVMPVDSTKNIGLATRGKVCAFDSPNYNRPILGRMDVNFEE